MDFFFRTETALVNNGEQTIHYTVAQRFQDFRIGAFFMFFWIEFSEGKPVEIMHDGDAVINRITVFQ
ncbi:hypothetical protein D3C80_2130570 [compost metagenome]